MGLRSKIYRIWTINTRAYVNRMSTESTDPTGSQVPADDGINPEIDAEISAALADTDVTPHTGESLAAEAEKSSLRSPDPKIRGRVYGKTGELAGHIAKLRYTLVRATSVKTMLRVYAAVLNKAQSGDLNAARLVFEYTIGKPIDLDMQAKVIELEELVADMENNLIKMEARRMQDRWASGSSEGGLPTGTPSGLQVAG